MKLSRGERRKYSKNIKKKIIEHNRRKPFNGTPEQFKKWMIHDIVLKNKLIALKDPEYNHVGLNNQLKESEEDAPNPDEQEEQDNE